MDGASPHLPVVLLLYAGDIMCGKTLTMRFSKRTLLKQTKQGRRAHILFLKTVFLSDPDQNAKNRFQNIGKALLKPLVYFQTGQSRYDRDQQNYQAGGFNVVVGNSLSFYV